jgi:hypothetical protein
MKYKVQLELRETITDGRYEQLCNSNVSVKYLVLKSLNFIMYMMFGFLAILPAVRVKTCCLNCLYIPNV